MLIFVQRDAETFLLRLAAPTQHTGTIPTCLGKPMPLGAARLKSSKISALTARTSSWAAPSGVGKM